MFRPIKNFINYIQNASGSAIFGGVALVAEVEATKETEKDIQTKIETETEIKVEANTDTEAVAEVEIESADKCTHNLQSVERKKMSKVIKHTIHLEEEVDDLKDENVNGIDANIMGEASVVEELPATARDYDCDDEDDIEMQIKRSIMIKKPQSSNIGQTIITSCTSSNGIAPKRYIVGIPSPREHNQNDAELSDELDDFHQDPMQSLSVAVTDTASVLSEDTAAGEDTAEEFVTEEEDVEEPFLDISDRVAPFASSEIIVLNDADLNSSIASDALSEDPLAIDDFTHPNGLKDTSHTLDSSTNDEASTSADILWINIEDIKANNITPNLQKDSCESTPTSTPQRQSQKENKEKHNNAVINNDENAEEIRSDGSDSGLGSETSALQTTLASLTDTSQVCTTNGSNSAPTSTSPPTPKDVLTQDKSKLATVSEAITNEKLTGNGGMAVTLLPTVRKPLRSNLKRRIEDDDALDSPQSTDRSLMIVSQQKKLKRSINFENVEVFYFPRQQGFGCVPSAGGCTLGMGTRHVGFKTLTLAEHAAELRRAHRLQLQEINPRGSSSDDSEESEEDYLSEGSGSDLDAESNGFLQPVSPKQRRALLKAAGVRKIDASEKIECRDIRNSREVCGCSCVEFCDPETCACNQAGIKCQVDRAMFPCGCTRDACGNTVGRVEFNPTRVRTHFIHTIMRLEMENRQQQNPPSNATLGYSLSASATATAVSQTTSGTPLPSYALPNTYYNLQSQSNYSSGYASPAYTGEQNTNYYQHQNTHYGAVATTEIHQTQSYQLDSLDAGLFCSTATATATATYSEMLPAYSGVNTNSNTASATYHNMNYAPIPHTPVSSFASYHQTSSSSYLPQHDTTTPSPTYSSCAVPSLPPYGTATTTAASPQYQHSSSFALDTTAPSCLTIDDAGVDISGVPVSHAGGSSFINLSTPIASSTRISQINDLLQHNRNTTATLVAVSSQCKATSTATGTNTNTLSSLNATLAADTNQKNEGNYGTVSDVVEAREIVSTNAEATNAIIKSWPEIDAATVVDTTAVNPTQTVLPSVNGDSVTDRSEITADESSSSVDTATTLVVTTAVDVVTN